jgi:flagellar hook-associated protein 2
VAPKIVFGTLANLGIELDKNGGGLTFNREKFKTEYAKDPNKIQEAGIGLGAQFEKMTDGMSTNIKSVITGRNSEIDLINTQIENWDVRLAAKKLALQKQYSDLEVALGKLKDQSSWLSGQIASLPSGSGG